MALNDAELAELVTRGFREAPFVAHLGMEPLRWGVGWVEARLPLQPWHLQQTGVVHAGVLTSFADHCAGTAAMTVAPPGHSVVSVEFKVNLLVGARAEGPAPRLECRATVLKPGRRFIAVEAEVFGFHAEARVLVFKLLGTMTPVELKRP
jgi:uncharacterized protein (TIGR00369 family)